MPEAIRSSDTDVGDPGESVTHRTVFYLSGFDPQGPGRYHAMYQSGAAQQAAVSGYRIVVGDRERAGPLSSRWTVQHESRNGERCTTDYHFLRWDDIVRRHWPRSARHVAGLTVSNTWRLLRNGVLWRVLQTSWPAFLALVVPAVLLLGTALGAVLSLTLCLWLIPQSAWLGSGVALGCLALWLWGGRRLQHWAQSAWLMRSTSVILKQARGELPELEQRLNEFACLLAEAAESSGPSDEVLVVGHSSGVMLAVSAVARALAQNPPLRDRPGSLSLLTLGECVPVLSYQPEAESFRRELSQLRHQRAVSWIDFTAPPDGCCFALIDPTAVCDDAAIQADPPAADLTPGPKRLSPRFAEMFSPATYASLRRDKYRCHFQYLMATERTGFYDYFDITSGTQRLAGRFAACPSVTGYTHFQCFGSPHR